MKQTSIVFFLFAFTSFTIHGPTSTADSVLGENTRQQILHKTAIAIIYHSSDGGKTWVPYDNGIPQDATVSCFLVINDMILATTDYHGIYSIKGGERGWKRIDQDLGENVDINAITTIGNSMVIGTLRHGILISKNNGRNWSNPEVQINTPVRCLLTPGNMLLAGGDNGIYRSPDQGNMWEHVFKGVQVNGFTQKDGKIFAALMNGAILSIDNGTTWKYIYKPHTLHDISADGESIYAMTLGAGLKKSNNDGVTWKNVNNGLGTLNFYTFEVKRFNNRLFAAQWHGIYTSDDLGGSWRLITNGLPDSTAFATLEVTRSGLVAGIGLRKKETSK